jgi:hypothetical protein
MENLNAQTIQLLRNNSKARYRMSYEFDVHTETVNRWINLEEQAETSTPLTSVQGKRALCEELDIKKEELTS